MEPFESVSGIDRIDDVYYVVCRSGQLLKWNDQLPAVTGYTNEEIESLQVADLIAPREREMVSLAIEEIFSDGVNRTVKAPLLLKAGAEILYEFSGSAVMNETGDPVCLVGIGRDISERRERERELASTKQQLRQIIDLVPDLVFAKNRDGEYLLANEAIASAYGREPDAIEGKTGKELGLDPAEVDEFQRIDLEVIESGDPRHIPEETLTTADGSTRILETTKIPFEQVDSGDDAVLGYSRDVTELKEYERRLKRQRDDLELLNQVLRHDIRNDLQIVRSYASLAIEHTDDQGVEYLEAVTSTAENAIDLTATARDLAEVLLGERNEKRQVSLAHVLESQIEDIRSRYTDAAIKTGSIPEIRVMADEMLGTVFHNLIQNGIEHNDSVTSTIRVDGEIDGEMVRIRVADNGPGIPDHRKSKIFGKGERGLDSDGTGIGLYLVSTLVDRYGGDVWVGEGGGTGNRESVRSDGDDPATSGDVGSGMECDGAVFWVELPRAESSVQ